MICPRWEKGMYCVNSRQRDKENVRYREYRCKHCGEKMYTIESATDEAVGRKNVNRIIGEKKAMGW